MNSVAALASALAKAQAALVNPEKSLTATIRGGRPGEASAAFAMHRSRAASTLSERPLASTRSPRCRPPPSIRAAGMVNLTTTLAHASGEWIASDWPVCPIAETANPQRMGAALTYARRYALFTLVGIAGEDDLDAPDLAAGTPSPAPPAGARSQTASVTLRDQPRESPATATTAAKSRPPVALLDPDASTALRDKLTGEVASLTSSELAVTWAQAALASKNRLTASDAKLVEEAFERKLAEIASSEAADAPNNERLPVDSRRRLRNVASGRQQDDKPHGRPSRIDKSVLKIAEPRRYRSKEHLRFVAQQACLICARKPSDPHHLRFMQPRALGRKVSDEFTVPLCRVHHRAVHHTGDERKWWTAAGIDPTKVAQNLWRRTRGTQTVPHRSVPITRETIAR